MAARTRKPAARRLAKEINRYEGDVLPDVSSRPRQPKAAPPILARDNITDLVDYLSKAEIASSLGRDYAKVFSEASDKATLNGDTKVSVNHIREALKENPGAINSLDRSLIKGRPAFDVAFEWYQQWYAKSTTPLTVEEKTRRKQRSAISRDVNKQFTGCITKQVEDHAPELLQTCLVDYDNPELKYERYRNLHRKDVTDIAYLKELEQGHPNRAALIKPRGHIAHLPAALREYLNDNYDQYVDHEREIKALRKYMSQVRENHGKELRRESSRKRRLVPENDAMVIYDEDDGI